MLSRFFIVIFIVSGVIFFSIETGNLMALGESLSSGKGAYILKAGRKHVVLLGGACKKRHYQAELQLLENFLAELLHPDHFADDLDVVVMNPAASNEGIRTVVGDSRMKGRCIYLQGSILIDTDQERCKLRQASMAFVLADVCTTFYEREDMENIVRALAIKRCRPIPMRLMLVSPRSIEDAARVGLPDHEVYCSNTLVRYPLDMLEG